MYIETLKLGQKSLFTGIIKEVGTIKSITDLDGGKKISIACKMATEVAIDQSISINGVCHTVVAHDSDSFSVQSVEETLRKTTIGDLQKGTPVNLERSLRPNQLLDGHLVQGHVDTTGTIKSIEKEGTNWLFAISYPKGNESLVVPRGSISIDGISLTVASDEANQFRVAIIPYTYEHTNLHSKSEGDKVNLEFDVLGKYVVRYLKSRGE